MIYKAGIQALMKLTNSRPTACVIRGQYRTHVLEFPKDRLQAAEPIQPQ